MSDTIYDVEVQRDAKWWMVRVPEIDGLTQARRLSEVEAMARSLIAISTDKRLDDVAVEIVSIRGESPPLAELAARANGIKLRRNQIRAAEAELLSESREFAHVLESANIPVRDIAELLGVSPQRVSQLLNEESGMVVRAKTRSRV